MFCKNCNNEIRKNAMGWRHVLAEPVDNNGVVCLRPELAVEHGVQKFFVMFLDHNGPVGVSALWADGGRWVRFYGDESKDYPRPVFYDDRASALKHARRVIGWIKRNRDQLLFRRAYSYKILPIRNAAE